MRYIKIKVKHIFSVAAVLAAIYALILFAYSKIGGYYYEKGKPEHAAAYYEKALSLTPDFLRSGEDIYDYANILSSGATESSLYKIFPYGHGGEGNIKVPTEEALNTAINLYKNLIENHSHDPWAKWGYVRLAEIYLYLGDYEEAEKYLLSGKANADAKLIYALYNSSGKYDKGIELLEDLIENNKSYFDIGYFDSLAQLYIQSGKYEDAIEAYKEALARVEGFEKEDSEESYYTIEKERLNEKIRKTEELRSGKVIKGECRGRVTVDGIGIEGVRVYIKDKSVYKEDFIGDIWIPFTLTDKDGYYLIDNVLPGEYDIGIGIRPEKILGKAYLGNKDSQKVLQPGGVLINDFEFNSVIEILFPDNKVEINGDKLELSWQQVKGAESYGIVTGLIIENGYASSLYMNDIRSKAGTDSNEATIDIKQLASHFMGFASFDDENTPTPGTLLGFYGGAKILYGIEAYDEDGRLIGSSMPIIKSDKYPRHFVFITQELEGDKLIKQEKYKEARDWFIDYLDKNPEDVHSLYVLAQYYKYCEKDNEKVKEYLTRLYEITGMEEYKKRIEFLKDE